MNTAILSSAIGGSAVLLASVIGVLFAHFLAVQRESQQNIEGRLDVLTRAIQSLDINVTAAFKDLDTNVAGAFKDLDTNVAGAFKNLEIRLAEKFTS